MNTSHNENEGNAFFESVNSLKLLSRLPKDNQELVYNHGISYRAVIELMDVIDLNLAMLCFLLGITSEELYEIKSTGKFSNEQRTKIIAIAILYGRGYALLEIGRSLTIG